jgi:hypothetical protein
LLKGIGVDAKSIINKSITIIGCGSVGSYIAYFLAKSGFKKFNLVDNDTLRIENIARHVCGYRYLNIPKTSALENHLQENFPDVEISVYQDDTVGEPPQKKDFRCQASMMPALSIFPVQLVFQSFRSFIRPSFFYYLSTAFCPKTLLFLQSTFLIHKLQPP